MDTVNKLSTTLSRASINKFYNPFAEFVWPEQLEDKPAFAPPLSTLQFLPPSTELSEAQRRRYWLLECINFFSLNIQGEKALIAGMAARLHENYPREVSNYLHHFIDEENKHMAVFSEFCQRYGGRIYSSRRINLTPEWVGDADDLLFFARIVIFEEVADFYNRAMMDDGTIDATVRAIHRMHHQDESRHLAFGRQWIGELLSRAENWSEEKKAAIADYLRDYMDATWRDYYNPYFLKDAGIANAYAISRDMFECAPASAFRNAVLEPCAALLRKHGLFAEAQNTIANSM